MRRTVVTGVGLVTAVGIDAASTWRGLLDGRDGHREVTLFSTEDCRSHLAAEIPDLPIPDLPDTLRRRTLRADRIGLLAAEEAVRSAGLADGFAEPDRVGVVMGAGAAGLLEAQGYFDARRLQGRGRVAHHLGEMQCGTGRWLAWRYGLEGRRSCPSTACSSSLTAIGLGSRWIASGAVDAVLVGGAESLSQLTHIGFGSVQALSPEPCRPFDRDRSGMSLGEGGAVLVLEEREAALARGARILAEVASFATSADAHHMTAPHPKGRGAAQVLRACLEIASRDPAEVDLVAAHGTGTVANDAAECAALRSVFGPDSKGLPVVSQKSAFGHCLGAAGAVECAIAVLALVEDTVPPNLRIGTPDPECRPFAFPDQPRPRAGLRCVLKESFGFGGSNAAMLLVREDDR